MHMYTKSLIANREHLGVPPVSSFISTDKKNLLMKAFINSQFRYFPLTWIFHRRTFNNRISRIAVRALRVSLTLFSMEQNLFHFWNRNHGHFYLK